MVKIEKLIRSFDGLLSKSFSEIQILWYATFRRVFLTISKLIFKNNYEVN
jgi:hypothetical protein